jgi:hypothetical protein
MTLSYYEYLYASFCRRENHQDDSSCGRDAALARSSLCNSPLNVKFVGKSWRWAGRCFPAMMSSGCFVHICEFFVWRKCANTSITLKLLPKKPSCLRGSVIHKRVSYTSITSLLYSCTCCGRLKRPAIGQRPLESLCCSSLSLFRARVM